MVALIATMRGKKIDVWKGVAVRVQGLSQGPPQMWIPNVGTRVDRLYIASILHYESM